MNFPSYCCPICGEQIGWLGRFLEPSFGWLLGRHSHRAVQTVAREGTKEQEQGAGLRR